MQSAPAGSAVEKPDKTSRTVAAKLTRSAPRSAPRTSKTKPSSGAPCFTSKQKRYNRGRHRTMFVAKSSSTQSFPQTTARAAKRQCVRRRTSAKRRAAELLAKSTSTRGSKTELPPCPKRWEYSATFNGICNSFSTTRRCRAAVSTASQLSHNSSAAATPRALHGPGHHLTATTTAMAAPARSRSRGSGSKKSRRDADKAAFKTRGPFCTTGPQPPPHTASFAASAIGGATDEAQGIGPSARTRRASP
mmetsp:Transcript_21007/g.59629  ORF Transcript_21007/g.59629 Transcript_21007/m.59629 type:complete len:248 (+) Transcript_21007:508-1251(+)